MERREFLRLAALGFIGFACGPESSKPTPQPRISQIIELPASLTTFEPFASPTFQPIPKSTPQPTIEQTSAPTQKPETPKPTQEPQPAKQENPQTIKVISRGNPNRPEVCLTFDAGAGSTNTLAILDVLKAKNVRATMFLTGLWMQQNPALAKRIALEHEYFNHSYDHSDFRNLSTDAIKGQLKRTEEISLQLTGKSTKPIFRPPYGGYDSRVLVTVAGEGYTQFVYWTFDTIDWDYDNMNPEASAKRIFIDNGKERQNLPGAIVLMHLDSWFEPITLGGTIDRLRAMGLVPTNLTSVLKP